VSSGPDTGYRNTGVKVPCILLLRLKLKQQNVHVDDLTPEHLQDLVRLLIQSPSTLICR
jgi:hypothetical protein